MTKTVDQRIACAKVRYSRSFEEASIHRDPDGKFSSSGYKTLAADAKSKSEEALRLSTEQHQRLGGERGTNLTQESADVADYFSSKNAHLVAATTHREAIQEHLDAEEGFGSGSHQTLADAHEAAALAHEAAYEARTGFKPSYPIRPKLDKKTADAVMGFPDNMKSHYLSNNRMKSIQSIAHENGSDVYAIQMNDGAKDEWKKTAGTWQKI